MLALPQSAHDANNDKLDTFIRLKKAGEGTYGVVYKCKDKITGKLVALKRIKLNRFENRGESEGIPSTAIREICLLKGLHHASVVELLDVIISDDIALHIVFEYLDMDLKKYLDASVESLPQDLIKSYMKQLMEGLSYLHSHRILHRDLKPQNLLLDREGHIKLADFGLSRAFSLPTRTYTHEVVTLWYRAPELLLGARIYSTAVDVWSVGCIMGEMVGRRPMFPGDSEIDQLYRIFRVLGTPSEESWKGVTRLPDYKSSFPQWEGEGLRGAVTCQSADQEEFIKTILLYDTIKRATARECLKMDYFKTVKLTTPNLKYFEDD